MAYAEALAASGVPVEQLQARGHIHSSFTMVDVIGTAVSGRETMAQALQRFAAWKSRLKEHRAQQLEPALARNGGRLVMLTGDGHSPSSAAR